MDIGQSCGSLRDLARRRDPGLGLVGVGAAVSPRKRPRALVRLFKIYFFEGVLDEDKNEHANE